MTALAARELLIESLIPRYGEGEAKALARIVFEDAFDRGRSFDPERFEAIQTRLLAGEPLQYVLGMADFWGLKFKVSPAVLIPRQETEELVAWVLEHLKSSALDTISLLDIGLGSGCIGITLKKKMPAIRLFGLEKSPEALAIAVDNATRILGPNTYEFMLGDILNRADWAQFTALDVVVSNPPYIPHVEKSLMPDHVLAHEPALALFVDDPDPLLFYRVIADFCSEKLRPGAALFFECNEFNAPEVAAMVREKGFEEVEIRKDLAGADRMLRAIWAG
jgi:release factor glutamine methyltransferase